MSRKTVKKLTKVEASRFFKSLIGTGGGTWEVTPNAEYAIRQGQIVYSIELLDCWPFGMKVQLTAFIGDLQIISKVLFDRDSHEPWSDEEDREKLQDRIGKALDKSNEKFGGRYQ